MSGYAESLDRDLPDLPEGAMTRVDNVQVICGYSQSSKSENSILW